MPFGLASRLMPMTAATTTAAAEIASFAKLGMFGVLHGTMTTRCRVASISPRSTS
jgi:hypothetical protein